MLTQQRYLRKKSKDPITNAEFDLLSPVQATAPTPGAPAAAAGQPRPGAVPRLDSGLPQEAVRLSRRSPLAGEAARRRAASWASRARARQPRFGSTTVAITTTSGSSSTSPRSSRLALGAADSHRAADRVPASRQASVVQGVAGLAARERRGRRRLALPVAGRPSRTREASRSQCPGLIARCNVKTSAGRLKLLSVDSNRQPAKRDD